MAELGLRFQDMPVTLQANLCTFVRRYQGIMAMWEIFDILDAFGHSGLYWNTIPGKVMKSLIESLESVSRPRYVNVTSIVHCIKRISMPEDKLPAKMIGWIEESCLTSEPYRHAWETRFDPLVKPDPRVKHIIHSINDTNIGDWFTSGTTLTFIQSG
jgi:hypothetical protein